MGTDFQKKVWQALLTIPYGETRSYGQIAKQIGNAKAVRAVGAANGKNPISIIALCHRVIGSTGKLTGFAGGLDVKERLLVLEGALIVMPLSSKTTKPASCGFLWIGLVATARRIILAAVRGLSWWCADQ